MGRSKKGWVGGCACTSMFEHKLLWHVCCDLFRSAGQTYKRKKESLPLPIKYRITTNPQMISPSRRYVPMFTFAVMHRSQCNH